MRFSTVVVDIDGTLINDQKVVPAFTCSELRRVHAEGVTLIFASSRMPRSIRRVMQDVGVPGHVVAYNGARVEATVDGSMTTLYSDPMDNTIVHHVLSEADLSGLYAGLFFGDHWAVSAIDYWGLREIRTSQTWPDSVGLDAIPATVMEGGLHKLMLRGNASLIDAAVEEFERLGTETSIYRPKGNIVEITSARSVKSQGVRKALDAVGGAMSALIAFGDNYNDIELIQEASVGVAVSNAKEELIQAADEITLSNNEDGVGYALRKHFPSPGDDLRVT